mmetsp:Transcript_2300/g.4645  ORF Transcript_2300/g.4645 Transcript_2300/m.4645 type:complete len:184 (-) Transcript_2300:41-592(-)
MEELIPDVEERTWKVEALKEYRGVITGEARITCEEAVRLVDSSLLPLENSSEVRVFYLKIKADFKRYASDFCEGPERQLVADEALATYQEAFDLAAQPGEDGLAPTNGSRLALALNFAVFYHQVLKQPDKACLLAKAAFDDAVSMMDQLEDEHYQEASTLMRTLRDNLTAWTNQLMEAGLGAD